eukprot:gene22110-29169_t
MLDVQSGDLPAKIFSRHMRDVIALCLQRDPTRRPTSKALLGHKFFKQARNKDYIAQTLLQGMREYQLDLEHHQ